MLGQARAYTSADVRAERKVQRDEMWQPRERDVLGGRGQLPSILDQPVGLLPSPGHDYSGLDTAVFLILIRACVLATASITLISRAAACACARYSGFE